MDQEKFEYETRYAITFGEVGIAHYGSSQIGKIAEYGFSVQGLGRIKQKLSELYPDLDCELIDLSLGLPENIRKENEAAVLHIHGFAKYLIGQVNGADLLYEEQENIEYDKKYFDSKKQKTLNKKARFNVVFGNENRDASEDYQQYTIRAFKDLKYLDTVREQIGKHFEIDHYLDQGYLTGLNAQGNKYYNQESGIGFHGDSERKIVICLSLGRQSILRYCWRDPHSSQNKKPIDLLVKHGDVYIMSEKATGNDWRKRSKVRLVHAAGSQKYIGK